MYLKEFPVYGLNPLIQKAMYFASKHHADQKRKGSDKPYSVHPISSALILMEFSLRLGVELQDEIIIAAILHDVLEDTEVTEQALEAEFSGEVLELVKAASEEDKSQTWDIRKRQMLKQLSHVPIRALYVPLADKIHNLFELSEDIKIFGFEESFNKYNAGAEKQKWYHQSTLEVLRAQMDRVKEKSKELDLLETLWNQYHFLFQQIFERENKG